MKVIIAGGGTGGHLFPGIALASAIMKNIPMPKLHLLELKEVWRQR